MDKSTREEYSYSYFKEQYSTHKGTQNISISVLANSSNTSMFYLVHGDSYWVRDFLIPKILHVL